MAFGFGTILLLGAVVTILALGSMERLRTSILNLTDAHFNRRQHIEALRSQIYVSGILVRDYLLDRRPGVDATYRDRLRESHAAALREVEELSKVSSSTSNVTVRSLAAELEAYWQSIDTLLEDTTVNPTVSRFEYLRTRIIPRRQAVITLAEELADTATAEARVSRQAVETSIDFFRRNTLVSRIITILLAVTLALFTTVRVFRLERAAAVEHTRIEQAEEEMRRLSQQVVTSQEHERRLLSRELHDHVGQMVTSLRFGLSDLEQQCVEPPAQFSETLGRCRLMLEETIEAIRGIAMGLRPSMLDDLGLIAAIEWQAREFARRFNLPVTANLDSRLTGWPEPQRTVLYRVTQEALTNCARHAQAKNVWIDLVQAAEFVTLSIADDGVGLSQGERARGFGLLGMEERVREIGGKLNVRTRAAGGTLVEVKLPLTGVTASD